MRVTRDEMALLGRVFAEKLNLARGPAAVAWPGGGLSAPNLPGGVFYDPEFADACLALFAATVQQA